jgi:GH24 family phage-related lysozyme (muramidase)
MKETLSVSDQGLRLIKAFEGYRAVDRELVSGARVVGHGHRILGDRAMRVSRDEAHDLLLEDLAPFEDMLNESVHAAITQAQFDALASLAFNIGPKAFLNSDVLRAVNAGRPLEAANAFDAWRKATLAGETFVVDALVRRRTAEKALFLRPPADGLAPKVPTPDVTPERDDRVRFYDDEPVLDRDAEGRLVSDAPYDVAQLVEDRPLRRREDGLAGDMAESERFDERPATIYSSLDSVLEAMPDNVEDEAVVAPSFDAPLELTEEMEVVPEAPVRTAIADAADEVRDRLEALMDKPKATPLDATTSEIEWPESLITANVDEIEEAAEEIAAVEVPAPTAFVEEDASKIVSFPSPESRQVKASEDVIKIDLLDADEDLNGRADIGEPENWVSSDIVTGDRETAWPWVILLAMGGGLFGAGAAIILRGLDVVFGQPGRLIGLGAAMIGGMILLGAFLYLMKYLLTDGEK